MNTTTNENSSETEISRLNSIISEALNKLEKAPSNLFTTSRHAIFIYELEEILRKA